MTARDRRAPLDHYKVRVVLPGVILLMDRAEGQDQRVRPARRAGELLADNPDVGPGKCSTLPHWGIDRSQSSRWQRIASLPEPEFDRGKDGQLRRRMVNILKKDGLPAAKGWSTADRDHGNRRP